MDRSILQVLPTLILTSSCNAAAQHQLSPETIFLHTIQGTIVIHQTTILLRTSPSTYATACTIFHRFYKCKTLHDYSVWSVALGSVFLACKIEEDQRRMRDVILVFLHVFRRFRLMMEEEEVDHANEHEPQRKGFMNSYRHPNITIASSNLLQQEHLTAEQKSNILRYIPPMSQYSQLYKEWECEVIEMENVILRSLGFTFYWIPDSHPHVFLLYFCNVLEIGQPESTQDKSTTSDTKISIPQLAWNYCNDSYRMDLCVRYEPELIACAAIHLASIDVEQFYQQDNHPFQKRISSLGMRPQPWWVSFLGTGREDDLAIICNAMLALRDDACVDGYPLARKCYIVSMVPDGSFCDPGSYIWTMLD